MTSQNLVIKRPYFDYSLYLLAAALLLIVIISYWVVPEFLINSLLLGIFIVLGFGLPRWQGRHIRIERALQAKLKEQQKWGFHSRDREGPWLNYIDFPLVTPAQCAANKFFYSEWLIIHDGTIIVNPGPSTTDIIDKTVTYNYSAKTAYAWDGCSPKRWFYWLIVFGTPDWFYREQQVNTYHANTKTVFWQQTHYASLVHDALYQYLHVIPISKQEVDALFRNLLLESGLCRVMADVYFRIVSRWGGCGIDNHGQFPNSEFVTEKPPL